MAITNTSFKPQVSTGALQVGISNLVVTTNDQISLPNSTKSLTIKASNKSQLTLSTSIGGDTWTIPPLCAMTIDGLELPATILYISSSIPATTVEIIVFYG
jgi:hypothetical protein